MSDYKDRSRRVAICLITNHEGNVLMGLRNDCKKWTCPGGHLEPGEDPYEGALRELEEETMLDADHIQLIKAKWEKDRNIMLYLFKVVPNARQIPSPEKDPDEECEFWDYIDPNDVAEDLHVPLEHNIALQYWMHD